MNNFSHVPPGFRFHPTDEELVDYYLRRKVASKRIDFNVIKDVDLYKIEPWDLQELCKIGTEEQSDWYFFSHKDKKYPTGTRTNRATRAGFWKATGRDKAIYIKNSLIGMRKTLVFYKGRAPNGQKSDWIMHEYRLETNENGTTQEEGWAVCRVFKKRIATTNRREGEHEALCWYGDHQVSFMPDFDSPRPFHHQPSYNNTNTSQFPCKQELHLQYNMPHDPFLQLPPLQSPRLLQQSTNNNAASCSSMIQYGMQQSDQLRVNSLFDHQKAVDDDIIDDDQVTDWRVLDKFVASQLSQENGNNNNNSNGASLQMAEDLNLLMDNDSKAQEMTCELDSVAASSSQIDDMWK